MFPSFADLEKVIRAFISCSYPHASGSFRMQHKSPALRSHMNSCRNPSCICSWDFEDLLERVSALCRRAWITSWAKWATAPGAKSLWFTTRHLVFGNWPLAKSLPQTETVQFLQAEGAGSGLMEQLFMKNLVSSCFIFFKTIITGTDL